VSFRDFEIIIKPPAIEKPQSYEVPLTELDDIFDCYHPEPLLIVISGPSGVGKDSVIERMKARGLCFYFVVTATSRAPRPGERPGIDYYFVSKAEFERMIQNDELLEHADVYGEYKGIPKWQVRQAIESNRDVIMRLDVQGAASIHAMHPEAVMIFLSPGSEAELERRLMSRKSEDIEKLRLRVQTARGEMLRVSEFDYVVENLAGKLDATVDAIEAIICAEHHRMVPRKVKL